MSKDWLLPTSISIILTVIIEWVTIEFFEGLPSSASVQAKIIDDAFLFLIYLSIPIFISVTVFLLYSILRFRVSGEPTSDAQRITGNLPITISWVSISFLLVAFVFIHPGVTGLLELRAEENSPPDIIVQVQAQRFSWKVSYLNDKVYSRKELVLPKDKNVQFLIDSTDVLHSFWIPAFRIKIDAVPGMTTHANATATEFGAYATDPNFRLQCAELCGQGHSLMFLPVRVVSDDEYTKWLAAQKKY